MENSGWQKQAIYLWTASSVQSRDLCECKSREMCTLHSGCCLRRAAQNANDWIFSGLDRKWDFAFHCSSRADLSGFPHCWHSNGIKKTEIKCTLSQFFILVNNNSLLSTQLKGYKTNNLDFILLFGYKCEVWTDYLVVGHMELSMAFSLILLGLCCREESFYLLIGFNAAICSGSWHNKILW